MLKIEVPRDSDIHTVADFAELLCLVTEDRVSSADTLQDHVRDNRGQISQNELDDCYGHLRWRQAAFGGDYPFKIDPVRSVMEGVEQLTDGQKFYVFMLLAANLPMLKQGKYKQLTDGFERAALTALRSMWSLKGISKAFGKNETDYVGAKWERLNKLGLDIGGRPQLSDKTFRERDTGDGGVDLVSWLQMDNFETENILSLLGQCACSREEWSQKQTEISRARLGHHLVPTHPWAEAIFIPICFRNNHGRWAFAGDVASSVVVDRLRMAKFYDASVELAGLPVPAVVQEVLDYRRDLV